MANNGDLMWSAFQTRCGHGLMWAEDITDISGDPFGPYGDGRCVVCGLIAGRFHNQTWNRAGWGEIMETIRSINIKHRNLIESAPETASIDEGDNDVVVKASALYEEVERLAQTQQKLYAALLRQPARVGS